ncbi:MAG: hypothetical protein E7361_04175 [Clostridiales bacterium]|nr:hypothetical protein [Clostridiales bacterium]
MKKNKVVLIISIFLLVFALIGSLFLDDVLGARISNIVTIITAITGAVALFIQFKKDKDLNMASFVIDYSVQFYDIYNLGDVLDELEKCRVNKNYKLDIQKYYKDIVAYLQWLESLASLVNSNLLTIQKIDDVLSYRFFLIVNNKRVQDAEIIPCKEFYRGIFRLYNEWAAYKKKNGFFIIFEENDLSKVEAKK